MFRLEYNTCAALSQLAQQPVVAIKDGTYKRAGVLELFEGRVVNGAITFGG